MSPAHEHGFLLPHDLSDARLRRLLGGESGCQFDDSHPFSLQFYDSFDWRLHAAQQVLFELETPAGRLLRLKHANGSDAGEAVESHAAPAWPHDLPAGPLRDRVSACLAMRVLLPVARVRGSATDLRLLNEDGKTVVRLQLLRLTSESDSVDEPRTLWPRLRILPVKGYEDEAAALTSVLADQHGWPDAPGCLLDEACAAVGREPGDYSSKLKLSLRPQKMAVDAMRKVFLTLLDTLERNVDGARRNIDSEFLHDLRVATRRTRSALTQVKHVLPDAVVADFKQRFAWVGQITGPTRDLDVFLLELPIYRASLPPSMRAGLDALEQRIHHDHATAQAVLADELASDRFRAVLADWRTLLEDGAFPGEPGWFADLPIERVASQRIWRMYKKVIRDGRVAAVQGEPAAMHELRKDCKKLRYLIEFFQSLYPADDMQAIVKTLKKLLDNLGDFQDKEVQAEHLQALAAEFAPSARSKLPTILAIGALSADSLRVQQSAHDKFAARFAAFDSEHNRARFKNLFKARAQAS